MMLFLHLQCLPPGPPRSTYTPHSYALAQASWVDSFLASNHYLEYAAVTRLGISDPLQYIKKRFSGSNLLFLSSCCLDKELVEQLENALEEALSSGSWLEVLPVLVNVLSPSPIPLGYSRSYSCSQVPPLLPSVLGPEDARQLVRSRVDASGALMLADCCVVSRGLVQGLVGGQEQGMEAR